MSASAFSRYAFLRSLKAGDSSRFGVDLKVNKDSEIDKAIACSRDPKDMVNFNDLVAGGKACVSYSDYSLNLVLRALANNLSYRAGVQMPDRDRIVRGVMQTLSDGTTMAIHRRDIRSFYENIPLEGLKDNFLSTPILAPRARNVLKAYFDVHCDIGETGVPRGLPISAVLSEIAMQPFDEAIRSHPGVYRYFRFSDDILIFAYDRALDADKLLTSIFPQCFQLNKEKRSSFVISGQDFKRFPFKSFDYLGYEFNVYNGPLQKDQPRPFSVALARSKIDKLKTRVILSLKNYKKVRDDGLLLDRLEFLAGNYRVSRGRINIKSPKRKVRSGIYFNYRHCREAGPDLQLPSNSIYLKELDGFLHSLLWSSKSDFSKLIRMRLALGQKARLRRVSFYHGFEDGLMRSFKPARIQQIKAAWAYVR